MGDCDKGSISLLGHFEGTDMKRRLVPLATIALMVLLSSCGSKKSSSETTTESATKTTKIVKIESETKEETVPETVELRGEAALKEALRQRLSNCLGIKGTAGASLRTIHQAVHFLQLANDGDYTLNIVSPVTLDFYNALSDTDKESFLETWAGIDYYTNTILYDFYSISNKLEDAGDLDAAKSITNSATIKEKWEIMRKGIDAVLPAAAENGESESETEVESTFETDKYGYHILGTDAYGNTVYETDENGNLISENSEEKLIIDEYGRVIHVPKESVSETQVETAAAETTTAPETTAKETKKETTTAAETETTTVPETTTLGYPTGGPGTGSFSNVILVSVDDKLDPSELNNLTSKYNLKILYDYQSYNMYAFACNGVTTEEQLNMIIGMVRTENHVTSVVQDKTAELH